MSQSWWRQTTFPAGGLTFRGFCGGRERSVGCRLSGVSRVIGAGTKESSLGISHAVRDGRGEPWLVCVPFDSRLLRCGLRTWSWDVFQNRHSGASAQNRINNLRHKGRRAPRRPSHAAESPRIVYLMAILPVCHQPSQLEVSTGVTMTGCTIVTGAGITGRPSAFGRIVWTLRQAPADRWEPAL